MTLVHSILKGIADDRALDGHFHAASPLRDFVEHYNKIALHDDNLPKITALSTGLQLKEAVSLLDAEEQVALLHKYSKATKTLDTPDEYREDPAKVEMRKMRMFMFKMCVWFLALLSVIMIGLTVFFAFKHGNMTNEGVFSTLIKTIGEILKVILSTSK